MKTTKTLIRLLALLLAIAASFSLVACKPESKPETAPEYTPETTPAETPAPPLPEKTVDELLGTLNGYLHGAEFNLTGDIEIINKRIGMTQTIAAECIVKAKDLDKEDIQMYVELTGIGADIYMTVIDGAAYMRTVQMGEEYKVKVTTDIEEAINSIAVTMANMPTFAVSDFISVKSRTEDGQYILEATGLTREKFLETVVRLNREDFESDEEYENVLASITFNNEEDYTLTAYYNKDGVLTHYFEHMKLSSDGTTMTQNSNTYVVNEPVVITLPADADEYVEESVPDEDGWWSEDEEDDELLISGEYAEAYTAAAKQLSDLVNVNVNIKYDSLHDDYTGVVESVYKIKGYGTDDFNFYTYDKGTDSAIGDYLVVVTKVGDMLYYHYVDSDETEKVKGAYTDDDIYYADIILEELDYMGSFNAYDFYSCVSEKDADGNTVYTFTGLKRDVFAAYVIGEYKEYYESREEYEAALAEYEFDNTKDFSITYTVGADGRVLTIFETMTYSGNSFSSLYEFSSEIPVIEVPADADQYVTAPGSDDSNGII